jgi:uncharacterized protein DUF4333
MRRLLGSITVAVAALAATACSVSVGTSPTVDKDALANEVSHQIEGQLGHAPKSVTCPDGLKREVGAQLRCEVGDGDAKYGVNITVTKVEGSDVEFSITDFVDKDAVAQQVSAQLAEQVGHAPESVTCPEDLEGKVGAKLRCELEDGGSTYGVDVTVTKVNGTNIKFNIKVDDQPS